ncbi:MAG: Gfo/Idh/MocA family oxidoreductase [Candidatus Ratteibacteria bacterium]|nr:Gfo/Idh/MocA family oxidoreductase [Candidatus Ratteibacteria bacterium]
MEKLKVGIIGTGGIAQLTHIPSLKRIEGVETTAIADVNQEKLRYVGEKFGIRYTFTDWEKLLETDIDAVIICSPNALHAEQSIKAMRSGKDVLCEKPVCLTSKEAEDIFSVADKTKKIFMAAFPRRFSGEAKVLKPMIDRGEFGEIYYIKASYLRRRGIPGLGTWFTDKKLAGGGPMMDVGVHMLDLVIYLSGAPEPEIIFGTKYEKFKDKATDGGWPPLETRVGDKPKGKMDVEDLACGFVKLSTGATLFVEASWAGNSETGLKASLFGTLAGVSMPDPQDPQSPVRIFSENHGVLTDVVPFMPPSDMYYEEMAHFIECVRKRKGPITKRREIMAVVKIIEGIYRSAETGKPVILKSSK